MTTEKITNELIEEDILKVYRQIGKIPTQENYKMYGLYSLSSVLNKNPWNIWLNKIFGKVNFDVGGVSEKKISKEDLLQNLKDLIELLGKTPTQEELKLGKYSKNAYRREFGNYSSALKELNLKPKVNFNLTNDEILEDLRRVNKELGRVPSYNEFSKLNNSVSATSASKKFGSWNGFLAAAGLNSTWVPLVSKKDVIDALSDWFDKNNKDVACLEYWAIRKAKERGDFPYCNLTISKNFEKKPWAEIMKECGYDYETVDQFIKRGRFQGFDGRTYLSSIEKQVGDCLLDLKKRGEINDYEYEKKVCAERNWTCDFVIENNNADYIWLEIDGMLNNRKNPYLSEENEKIEYYKENNFNYFILTYRTPDIKKAIKELVGE